jgi:hypothetical protein
MASLKRKFESFSSKVKAKNLKKARMGLTAKYPVMTAKEVSFLVAHRFCYSLAHLCCSLYFSNACIANSPLLFCSSSLLSLHACRA